MLCMSEYMSACARVCLPGAQTNVNSLGPLSYVAFSASNCTKQLEALK